ncbi:hypothetical protein T492DRAFT_1030824 [Pavlovales sp. CCMP2436]|nr:hypothetical protein T492DRAFT_1030824 [Pavlovales sp. CCMP2436]
MAWVTLGLGGHPPAPRECAGVSLSGGKLLTFGGMYTNDQGVLCLSGQTHVFDAASDEWALVPSSGAAPLGRSGHAMVAIPGAELGAAERVVVMYGLSDTEGHLSDVSVFDVANKVWTLTDLEGPRPSARDKLAATAFKGLIYVHGGFGAVPKDDEEDDEEEEEVEEDDFGVEMAWFSDTHCIDIDCMTSTKIETTGATPPPRAAHSLVALGVGERGELFMFGGRTQGGRTNDLWRLDLATSSWAALEPAGARPPARSFQSSCALSGSQFVVFGGLDTKDVHLDDLHSFDAILGRWARVQATSGPTARACCALGRAGDALIVFGGSSNWVAEMGAPSCFHGETFALPIEAVELAGRHAE